MISNTNPEQQADPYQAPINPSPSESSESSVQQLPLPVPQSVPLNPISYSSSSPQPLLKKQPTNLLTQNCEQELQQLKWNQPIYQVPNPYIQPMPLWKAKSQPQPKEQPSWYENWQVKKPNKLNLFRRASSSVKYDYSDDDDSHNDDDEEEDNYDEQQDSNLEQLAIQPKYEEGSMFKPVVTPHQPSQKSSDSHLYEMQKNNVGKHFNEEYKRDFAKMLLQKTAGLERNTAYKIIAREADGIKVYSSEVSIWLQIYRIVFAIQQFISTKHYDEIDLTNQIESRLIDYLNEHPNEKKYKFIKICNRTFRSFRIKKSTGDYWLRELFRKYDQKLDPRVNTVSLLKKLNKNGLIGNQFSGFDDVRDEKRAKFINLKCERREESYGGSMPTNTKQKIIRKIDHSIESAISKIFQQKMEQFAVSATQLKSWYMRYGKLQLFNPQSNSTLHDLISSREDQFNDHMGMGMGTDSSNMVNECKRAEREVLNFIKMNPNCTKAKVYSFACSIVQRLGVQQLMNQTNFSSWFNHILMSYCIIFNQYVQLKSNNPKKYQSSSSLSGSKFQIPIITPKISSSTNVLYNQNRSQI